MLIAFVLLIFCGVLEVSVTPGTTALLAGGQTATSRAKNVWDGVYTKQQALRGKRTYHDACSYCHRDDLQGGTDVSPNPVALKGSSFFTRWDMSPVAELFATIQQTMPRDGPGSLNAVAVVEIISFLLEANGLPPGTIELPVDADTLRQIVITEVQPAK